MNQPINQQGGSTNLPRKVLELHRKGYELDFSVTPDYRIRCNQNESFFTVGQVCISLVDRQCNQAGIGYQYIHAVETCCGDKGILIDCCPYINAFLTGKLSQTEPKSVTWEPFNIQQCGSNGALRLTALFLELLEKQFPVSSPAEKMQCRFPLDFAEKLSVHVNHLNRSLKDVTGKTTSQLIAERITQEASVLLYGSRWNVCEIGYCFGFDEGSHFINFFKKNAKMSPTAYRRLIRSKLSDMGQLLSA